ncbi:hypothetical protein ACFL3V_04825 [Nanoarchaeota archaeon]
MNRTEAVGTTVDHLNNIAANKLDYDNVIDLFRRLRFDVKEHPRSREATVKGDLNNGIRLELMLDALPGGIDDGVAYENVGLYGTMRYCKAEVVQEGCISVLRQPTERFYTNRWNAPAPYNPVVHCQEEMQSYRSVRD